MGSFFLLFFSRMFFIREIFSKVVQLWGLLVDFYFFLKLAGWFVLVCMFLSLKDGNW